MTISEKNILILLMVLFYGCQQPKSINSSYSGKIERTYIVPQKIVWKSDKGLISNSENLLKDGSRQASLINNDACVMSNSNGQASIILDYGKELHGGLEIITGMFKGKEPILVRIRFGESVSEVMVDINENTGATNDHAIRDWNLSLPWLGKIEIGNTGFRFVRIDLLDKDRTLLLKEVNGISVMRDIPYLGSFESNDERLNKIWKTGAYTVHLNMQEYLWDGIKRDRLVWVGDMHPEVMTILSVFGDNEVIPKTLDFIADITPQGDWMNGLSSYSMWWVLILHQYYMNTGDVLYLKKHESTIISILEKLAENIDENGKETLDGRFLDWPTSEDNQAIHAGLQSLMVLTFDVGREIGLVLDNNNLLQFCEQNITLLKKYNIEIPSRKSPGALMVLAGIADAKTLSNDLLLKGGVKDLSTFYGFYVLNALAKAGNHNEAIDFIRDYWGGMLDLGATTFWEDFDIDWLENGGPIDQLPMENKIDVHATYGGYCYEKYRHSLCHGWASGPTAWLSHNVLGVKVIEAGCKVVKITPNLGDLQWVEGTYPTPQGLIKIRHEKQKDGTIKSKISAPRGIKVIKD